MGLKILHSADWHLDSPLGGVTPEQRQYLQQELRRIPWKVAQLCQRENCDLVLLSGDLFDGAYTKETARELYVALKQCAVPVFISPGNHDFISPDSPWMGEQWPENVRIFTGETECVILPDLDCRVYGGGFRTMDCPGRLEGFRAEGTERYALGVFHGDPIQQNSPYCPITAQQVLESGLHYLALGHIHKKGDFRAGDTLCAWPGCPMGRGYDETGEKGVYIVSLDDRAELRFVPLDVPRFYDLEVDTDVCSLDEVLPGAGNRHFYRITLRGSDQTPPEELYRRFSGFPNLELTDCREEPVDPWNQIDEDTLEGVYFRLLREKITGRDPDEDRRAELAAEISARLLKGREVAL